MRAARLFYVLAGILTWITVGGGVVVPLAAMAGSLGGAGVWGEALRLDAADRTALFWTVALACAGTLGSLVLSLPVAWFLAGGHRLSWAAVAFVLIPLLVPPYALSFAWESVTGHSFWRGSWLAGGPVRSAWVTSSWLWPIPCLSILAGWRQAGRPTMEVALLDASPHRAFLRAALPALRPFVLAGLAVVFFLAVADSTVAELSMTALGGTYARVMLAKAELATPLGAIVVRSWPLFALMAVAAVVLLWQGRAVAAWGEPGLAPSGSAGRRWGGRWLARGGLLVALGATVVTPIGALVASVQQPEIWRSSLPALAPEWQRSLVVASVVGACCAITASWLTTGGRRGLRRFAMAGFIVMGVLPAAVTGYATATAYNRLDLLHTLSRAATGDPFAYEPFVWMLALVGRFAFIAVLMAAFASRRLPSSTIEQACIDGADSAEVWWKIRLPALASTLAVAGLVVASLTLGEVIIGTLLRPPGPWSIAVTLLDEMHRGRYDHVVVSTLLLIVPAFVLAIVLSIGSRFRERAA